MKCIRLLVLLAATLPLGACVAPLVIAGVAIPTYISPAIETAHEAVDSSNQSSLKARAEAGDMVAQYDLGESFCCHVGGPLDRVSVYDNLAATNWYCKSAHQGYGPAQMRLAKIYSGHPGHGFRFMQWASALVGNVESDLAVALLWAKVAAARGDSEGVELRDDIRAHATPAQRVKADALFARWKTAPCRWAEVFPSR